MPPLDPTPDSITFPAFGIGQTMTVRAPRAWHARISAIAATGCTKYGATYSRWCVDTLQDLHDAVRNGYTAAAYDHLVAAERFAGITSPVAP